MENEKSKIVLVKLYCGDYIIGEESNNRVVNGKLCLDNPRIFGIAPTAVGSVGIVFQPVCLFSSKAKKQLDINENEIMCKVDEDEINKEIVNGYKSDVTGIKIASSSESAVINGSSSLKPGEFVL